MKLVDYTTEASFLPRVECRDRAELLRQLVGALNDTLGLPDPEALVREVLRREDEGSTAVGQGLSLPHARFAGLHGVHLAVATLATPISPDADGEDSLPIDVVILIVGPRDDPRQLLRVLVRLTRLVRAGQLLPALRAGASGDDLRDALADTDARLPA
jgi:mannitol/fructose-specific phosphotransferase system IIA component (Ntr-type)